MHSLYPIILNNCNFFTEMKIINCSETESTKKKKKNDEHDLLSFYLNIYIGMVRGCHIYWLYSDFLWAPIYSHILTVIETFIFSFSKVIIKCK